MKLSTLCLLLLCSPVLAGEGKQPSAKDYIKILKDEKAPPRQRIAAVEALVKHNERAAIPVFLEVLPGRYDRLAITILQGLATFADPKALPSLEKYGRDSAEKEIIIPGKVMTVLLRAIEACTPKEKKK